MTTIKLGIIGTGLAVEKLHWPALQALGDRFQVVAFCDIERRHAEHFAGYAQADLDEFTRDYHALLAREDIDAVLISLPIPLQGQVLRDSLLAGKHVLCEKPQAASLEEADAIWPVVDAHPNQVVMIGENWFYRDDLRYARSLIDAGVLGRIHTMNFRRIKQLVPQPGEFSSTPWRWQGAYEGGPHLDGGVHQIAAVRMLMGDVERVSAEIQDANVTHGGPSVLVANMRFVDNAVGNMTLGSNSLDMPPDDHDLRIYGTDGVMSINDERLVIWKDGETQIHSVERQDFGYINEFQNFYEAVTAGEPVIGDYLQSWRGMELVSGSLASAESGQFVYTDTNVGPLSPRPIDIWLPRGVTEANFQPEISTHKGLVNPS